MAWVVAWVASSETINCDIFATSIIVDAFACCPRSSMRSVVRRQISDGFRGLFGSCLVVEICARKILIG